MESKSAALLIFILFYFYLFIYLFLSEAVEVCVRVNEQWLIWCESEFVCVYGCLCELGRLPGDGHKGC